MPIKHFSQGKRRDTAGRGRSCEIALLGFEWEEWSVGAFQFWILEFGLQRTGRTYSTAETLRAQRIT
jgi:hypothetical protein